MISQLETLLFIKDVPYFPMISPYFIVDFPWSCYVFANQKLMIPPMVQSRELHAPFRAWRNIRAAVAVRGDAVGWVVWLVPLGYCKQEKDVENPWENPMHMIYK